MRKRTNALGTVSSLAGPSRGCRFGRGAALLQSSGKHGSIVSSVNNVLKKGGNGRVAVAHKAGAGGGAAGVGEHRCLESRVRARGANGVELRAGRGARAGQRHDVTQRDGGDAEHRDCALRRCRAAGMPVVFLLVVCRFVFCLSMNGEMRGLQAHDGAAVPRAMQLIRGYELPLCGFWGVARWRPGPTIEARAAF